VLLSRDGSEWPVDDSAAPIRGADGELLGTVLVFHEISERRRLERLAETRLQELTDAGRRKDEFLAMLAHELRNPLSPILTATAILKAPSASAERVERARAVVERQVRHMVRMIDDLLDVSRITRGKITLRKEQADLATILHEAVETSRTAIEEQRHQLEVLVPPTLPPVAGDATRLEQVFSNLLNNAAKYTPPGGRITLTASAAAGTISVSVKDNGIGMSRDLLQQVFDLFVQGDSSLHRSRGGLGIGLTLVKHLVELHGGTVSARSDGPGQGSELTVELPVAAEVPRAASVTEAAPAQTRALRFLVVDDNTDVTEMLAAFLEDNGHEVVLAHDGPRALERARMARPDVVLLDIGLPGMDGYEVARRLRQSATTRGCTMIALTGYAQEEHRHRSAEAGISAHLTKPVDPAVLLDLVARLR
jgi:two-component system CheB/CheR fusion protein